MSERPRPTTSAAGWPGAARHPQGPRGPGPDRVGQRRPRARRRGAAQRRGGGRAVPGRGLRLRRHRQRRRRRAGGDRAQGGPGGRADRAALRPPRRPARERPRRLGLPAVRADRARTAASTRRGAADDKAGIVAHLGALRVFGDDLPVSVTMFIEGEEEVGSDTLPALLQRAPRRAQRRRHRDRRLRQLGHRRARADHQPARPGPRRRRGPHAHPRRPLRHVGRAGARRADRRSAG